MPWEPRSSVALQLRAAIDILTPAQWLDRSCDAVLGRYLMCHIVVNIVVFVASVYLYVLYEKAIVITVTEQRVWRTCTLEAEVNVVFTNSETNK